MNVLAVSLPMPPPLSALTNNAARVGRIKSSAYKSWQAGAGAMLRASWKAQGSPSFDKHLSVTIHLGLDYRGDIANREKALTDLFVQTIPGFPDDRYIDHMVLERVPGLDGARVIVQQIAPPSKRVGEAIPIGELVRPIVDRIAEGVIA